MRAFARSATLGMLLAGLTTWPVQAAGRRPALIEVRFEAQDGGEAFNFAGGTRVMLEPVALLEPRHFATVEVRPTSNPNTPGTFEIEVVAGERGRKRLQAGAGYERQRRTCLLLDGVVQTCSGFAPAPKRIYDRGQVIYSPSNGAARAIAARLEQAISEDIKAERALAIETRTADPRRLLDQLYRQTLKAGGSSWIDDQGRTAYLSNDLVELWDEVDARIASGMNEVVIDADPVAATNGLEMKSYRIVAVRETATRAKATVTVGYGPRHAPRQVEYALVRERGHWRIADIGTGMNSLKAALTRFARPSPADEPR